MAQFFKFQILHLTPYINVEFGIVFCQKAKALETTVIWVDRGFLTENLIFYFVWTVLSNILVGKLSICYDFFEGFRIS